MFHNAKSFSLCRHTLILMYRGMGHSLRVHSCVSMLNNICSESMSTARMCLYSIGKGPIEPIKRKLLLSYLLALECT